MTASTSFVGTNMLCLVRQQDNEFNTLPFAGFRERKGVFCFCGSLSNADNARNRMGKQREQYCCDLYLCKQKYTPYCTLHGF